MESRDLIVTPVLLMLVYAGAYIVRPWVTDQTNRKYFLPALSVRIIGALALGFIYQFYYNGGDTFNYHTHGSRHIWEAFIDSPSNGFQLLFAGKEHVGQTFKYSSQIAFFGDPSSYFIVRIAAVIDLLTFSSYSATAVVFAVISFAGMWAFFLTFYRAYPNVSGWIAITILFVPSVFFWGSGILKDTVTLTALGFLTFAIRRIFIEKRINATSIFLLIVCTFVIYSVKKYILLCYLPAALVWVQTVRLASIKSAIVRVMVVPFFLIAVLASSYYAVTIVGENDEKYAMENLAKTAQITAYDIGYYTGRGAGSSYSIGELDGTFTGMLKLIPQAVNVSLFRPYLWEASNPLMLLSALESLVVFGLTIFVIYRKRLVLVEAIRNPDILFCLIFSVTFAFAVGVSTFNFGTLTRYKIPLIPFYLLALILMLNYSKSDKKFL